MNAAAVNIEQLRQQVVATGRRMNAAGINQGTSGNLSVRLEDGSGLLITPSSVPYELMQPEQVVAIDWQGRPLPAVPLAAGSRPSSEWQLHADLLRQRADLTAVLHCHSLAATAMACHSRGIPSFHYMVAVAGGDQIRCAPYATFEIGRAHV